MATTTTPEKRLMAAGAVKGAAWGTALPVGALDGMLIDDDGGLKPGRNYLPAKEADTPFVLEGDLGPNLPVDFSPAFFMRYDPGAIGLLMAQLFGTAGAPTDLTGAYKHTFQWADEIEGLFSTFVVERRSKIFEVPSCKPYSLNLTVADGLVRGAIGLKGDEVKDDSAINTATQVDALTYDDRDNRVKFTGGSVKMNAQAGADVAAETALVVNDMSLSFEHSLDEVVAAGDDAILEPLENDHPRAYLTLGFPRMSAINDLYFAAFNAETIQKVLVKFTGALITGALYYDLAIYYPQVRITDIEYTFSEIVPASVTLEAEEPATAPTGMTYKRPYIELVNTKTTDYLA